MPVPPLFQSCLSIPFLLGWTQGAPGSQLGGPPPSEGSSLGKLLTFGGDQNLPYSKPVSTGPPLPDVLSFYDVCLPKHMILYHVHCPQLYEGAQGWRGIQGRGRLRALLSAILWDLGKLFNLSEPQFPFLQDERYSNLTRQF